MIELLLSELKDPYIRENFRRIKLLLNDIESRSTGSGSGDIINNIISSSIWEKETSEISALNTQAIDQIDINDFLVSKYIISVRDESANKTSTMEMTIKNENGSISDSIFAKISGGINFNINAVLDTGSMKLNLTNNENNNLSVILAKITL
jgi:hypothetical protein